MTWEMVAILATSPLWVPALIGLCIFAALMIVGFAVVLIGGAFMLFDTIFG